MCSVDSDCVWTVFGDVDCPLSDCDWRVPGVTVVYFDASD